MRREDIGSIHFGGTEIPKDSFLANEDTFRSLSFNFLTGRSVAELQKPRSNPAQRAEYLQRANLNYRLSRAHRLIETHSALCQVGGGFSAEPLGPQRPPLNIIRACVVLHNLMLQESPHSRLTYNPPGYGDHDDWQGSCMEGA
ncbi:hypothetical protein HPB51_025810 [Rhipicephalus microplus]|uniref:DDE Tnp4 domain-containing protein n=1 Tax=Rhipicephalus microplus TaxID=6941 RepID=A0A9J6DX53_RHIMP|nr:hypothetical protein HPB51_025810 [Rhipicephalus microplus]